MSESATEKAEQRRTGTRQMILENSESVKMYTGLNSKEVLLKFFNIITKKVQKINYWRGSKKAQNKKANPHPGGRSRATTWFDEYLLTLVYLREGLSMNILGSWFAVSLSNVSSIISTWVNLMFQILKKYLVWPSTEQVKSSLPSSYPAEYADTRVILDCAEFFLRKPKNCSSQAATYSQYKHHNTVKVLIGITPRGLITFVSKPYGGNASDRYIMENEFLDKIEPGNAVMVDRGFNVSDLLLQRGAKLHMPPFTRKGDGGKKFLNQEEILKTREIAALRIHVERAIERMKNFKILSQTMDLKISPNLYQILVIVSVFCNLNPPLLE